MRALLVMGEACESFCNCCGQLRLWARPEPCLACGGCGSPDIELGPVGGAELPELRAAWQRARGEAFEKK